MAYPGGGAVNSTDTAAMFYAGIRAGGSPPHAIPATNINYLGNNSIEPLDTTTIPTILAVGAPYRRGWACFYLHYLNTVDYAPTHNCLLYLKTHEDSLWITTYLDLIKYAQERDTRMLTVNSVTSNMITFTLTDSMMDTLFNYPLTVKVRIDSSWDSCSALQNGRPMETRLVTYAGNKYALVKAVPDRGAVQLLKSGTTGLQQTKIPPPNDLTTGRKATLYDLRGRQLGRALINPQGAVSVDVTGGLPTGIYLLKIDGTNKYEKRLLVR
jgi:hypothetical protein